jgi:hypothetical protein
MVVLVQEDLGRLSPDRVKPGRLLRRRTGPYFAGGQNSGLGFRLAM